VFTIEKAGAAEQTITKSRFLAWAAACQSEQEVGAFLRAIAAQHPNAHHLAYAFRVKTAEGIIPRFSDAGEPSGTAGKPILQMLEGQKLINVAVGVIRYYGGVNLGTGGLARAYGGTAKMALDAAKIVPFVEMQLLKLSINYKRVDELTNAVTKLNGKVIDKLFGDMSLNKKVHVQVSLPAIETKAFLERFSEYI
jgi:uncharacterized YigZ family protein